MNSLKKNNDYNEDKSSKTRKLPKKIILKRALKQKKMKY